MRGSVKTTLRLAPPGRGPPEARGNPWRPPPPGPEAAVAASFAVLARDCSAQQPSRALGCAERHARDPVLELLGAPRARDPLVLALHVPRDRGLERLLVRARAPAERSLRLRGPVGPAVPGRPHLRLRERPRAPAGTGQRRHRLGGP